jgi:hypothetical protein
MKDDIQIGSDFNYYQNANADVESIKAGFLVRQYEYGVIVDDLLRNPKERSVQHYLLLGRRGSGKSTLLRRLQIEIETNEKLSETYIAVNLAEEQANIYRFYDLLEEIMRELEFRQVQIEWPDDSDVDVYSRVLLDAIHEGLSKQGKRLVLLLDNIDRVFESLGEDVALLREYLQNYGDIKIVGGSTRMTEYFWSYNNPFYEFFRVLQLKPLDNDEMKKLLLYWADRLNAPALKEFVEKRPGQLETVRILTDGLPRTLQFFVNILLTHESGTGYDYLRLLMDKVTPLYQERLNHLPPSQRKIVLQLSLLWEAAGAKELAAATRMENKVVSAQLAQLIEKGVVEKVPTGTKNHMYRLAERFFNLWLIFTQGSPREKRRARYLSIFLENFYDAEEFNEMAMDHYWKVKQNSIAPNKAALLTKAFAQSHHISSFWRDILIDSTVELPGLSEVLRRELPETIKDIIRLIFAVPKISSKRILEAIQAVEQKDGVKEYLLGLLQEESGDLTAAEQHFLTSCGKGFSVSAGHLAVLYENKGDENKAERYHLLAYEGKVSGSAYNLAFFYYKCNKNKEQALQIVQTAIERGEIDDDISNLTVILKVWNGKFENLREELHGLINEGREKPAMLVVNLLAHHQVELVNEMFYAHENIVDKVRPLYYLANLFQVGSNNTSLKIPPELEETVNRLRDSVDFLRGYFYPTTP